MISNLTAVKAFLRLRFKIFFLNFVALKFTVAKLRERDTHKANIAVSKVPKSSMRSLGQWSLWPNAWAIFIYENTYVQILYLGEVISLRLYLPTIQF